MMMMIMMMDNIFLKLWPTRCLHANMHGHRGDMVVQKISGYVHV